MSINLDHYLVPGTESTYYIPEFVTEDEEEYLLRKVSVMCLGFRGCISARSLTSRHDK